MGGDEVQNVKGEVLMQAYLKELIPRMVYYSVAHMLKLPWFPSVGQAIATFILHHLHIFPPKGRINVSPFQSLPHSCCSVSGK